MGKLTKIFGIILVIVGIVNLVDGIVGGFNVIGVNDTQLSIGSYIVGIVLIVIGIFLARRD